MLTTDRARKTAVAGAAGLALLLGACSLPQAETQSDVTEGQDGAPAATEPAVAEATGEPAQAAEPAEGEVQDLATEVEDVGGDQGTVEPDEPTEEPVEPTAAPVAPTEAPVATEETVEAVDAQPVEPLASTQGTSPFALLEITDLRRVGDTVTLEFAITTDDRINITEASERFAAGPDLVSGTSDEGEAGGGDDRRMATSGVTLVDEANRNRHLVLRDASGQCLCTRLAPPIDADTVMRHSAQFPAPPDDVEAMTVAVPQFPALDNVPLRPADA